MVHRIPTIGLCCSVLLSAFLLSGCGIVAIPPSPFGNNAEYIQSLSQKYGTADFDSALKECSADDASCLIQERNKIIDELSFLIEYNYQVYEGNVFAGKAKTDFGFGMTTAGLTLGAAVSSVESTKTAIASVASLVASTDTEINKNFYMEQTTQALIVKMRASMKEIKLIIETGRATSNYSEYTLAKALSDLTDYYRAGTLAQAVQKVFEEAGRQDAEATDELETFYSGEATNL